jgi:N-dimethylarginine dimethylaminohydrolase
MQNINGKQKTLLPLRQKTEFGTLREVVLGRTDKSAFPPKCKANFDYILGFCAPGVATAPKGAFLDGIPEPLKDWDFIWLDRDECAIHGAGNLVPLGPDSSGQHRVIVPAKTPRVAEEIEKRGVRAIPVEVELGARNGGGIRCATLVLNCDG